MEPGEEADFLAEQGFTEDDLFYEYEYAGTSDVVYQLSLYCDEYVTRGVGFIREYEDGEYTDLEMFTFDGCEQYLDDAAVGQYSVYSTYDDGRETYFLDETTIDDYFGAMDLDEIHSVSFDYWEYTFRSLLRIIKVGKSLLFASLILRCMPCKWIYEGV